MTFIRTRKLVRRSVLKGLGATAALVALPHVRRASAAEAIEQASFEITCVRDPQLGAQLAIAEHHGYFKDEGLTVTIHWNEDKSVHQLLDLYDEVNKETPIAPLRWSIAHLDNASPATLTRN